MRWDHAQTNTLDLSLASLRSYSPIHIQYLQNMGIGATLAISCSLFYEACGSFTSDIFILTN